MTKQNSLKSILFIVLALFVIGWRSSQLQMPIVAQDIETPTRPLLLTHYMPWYQTPDVSGYWGWHWTMNHFDPDQRDENGRQQFASHYLPLTGLYDSQDEAVLEYQVLLMKLSGIDGVIVDWYGTENFRDYAVLNESTGKLFDYVKRAGLKFVICYEDQTVKHMVAEKHIKQEDARSRGQEDMQYLQDNWFNNETYLRYQDQPLLFIFGPQYFRSPDDWETMFSGLDTAPSLVTLDRHMGFGALASYPWPPMHMAGGATLAPAALQAYLELFYRNARRNDFIVGGAFPAFHDIYKEAGVRSSYGYLDPQAGDTLKTTINLALENNADIIQLITWNDYGEGTMIEPTEETGYRYLEIVQETRRILNTTDELDFTFTTEDLRLPLQLFNLRKAYAADTAVQARLDEVFNAIIANDLSTATAILGEF